MAAGDPANELLLVVPVGDVDGLDAADPVDDLDAVDVWRGGELWALADVNGPSATIARAMNGMGVAKDVIVATPEEVEKYRDVAGTIIYPAMREGKLLYERVA